MKRNLQFLFVIVPGFIGGGLMAEHGYARVSYGIAMVILWWGMFGGDVMESKARHDCT
jgi:hypothetical protein